MAPAPCRSAPLRLDPARAALLVVDVQTRLSAAMAEEDLATCTRNWLILVELARRLRLPVVWSEQYPQGLGPTLPRAGRGAPQPGLSLHRIEKITFSCTDCDALSPLCNRWADASGSWSAWRPTSASGRPCAGCSAGTPRCTCRPMRPSRARRPTTRSGLRLCERAGAVVTSTETVAFDALGRAGTDDFKAISRLVR